MTYKSPVINDPTVVRGDRPSIDSGWLALNYRRQRGEPTEEGAKTGQESAVNWSMIEFTSFTSLAGHGRLVIGAFRL